MRFLKAASTLQLNTKRKVGDMSVNGIDEINTIENIIKRTTNASGARKTGELGKDEFLNLLITQLKYQDPLEPMEDKEFIAQMAQFSSLEQMKNVSTSVECLKAYSLIGKTVKAVITDESDGSSKTIEGEAEGVRISGGNAYLVLKDGDVPVDKVVEVSAAVTEPEQEPDGEGS